MWFQEFEFLSVLTPHFILLLFWGELQSRGMDHFVDSQAGCPWKSGHVWRRFGCTFWMVRRKSSRSRDLHKRAERKWPRRILGDPNFQQPRDLHGPYWMGISSRNIQPNPTINAGIPSDVTHSFPVIQIHDTQHLWNVMSIIDMYSFQSIKFWFYKNWIECSQEPSGMNNMRNTATRIFPIKNSVLS